MQVTLPETSITTLGDTIRWADRTPGLTVFVSLFVECPIAQAQAPVISALHQQFGIQVRFVGVWPQALDTSFVSRFSRRYQFTPPVVPDPECVLIRQLAMAVVPEVVLVNQEGIVLYRGQINNQFQKVGKRKPAPTEHFLAAALTQALKNTDIKQPYTTPRGCLLDCR
jgi:hypothetical protein